jgi:hypothetical protein
VLNHPVIDQPAPIWHKSSRSGNGGNCVEVAMNLRDSTGHVLLRDSKDPDGPVHRFTEPEWAAFIGGVKDGEFEL